MTFHYVNERFPFINFFIRIQTKKWCTVIPLTVVGDQSPVMAFQQIKVNQPVTFNKESPNS